MAGRRQGRYRRKQARPIDVGWTDRALQNLEEIDAYIARASPGAASRWVQKLIAAAEQAAVAPFAGRVVPEKNRQDIREVFVRTYRIAYRIRETRIDILTVFEGHHHFPRDVLTENDKDAASK
jgi:toxin ParE1/3/4